MDKEFIIYETITSCYGYKVDAKTEAEAVKKLSDNNFEENDDIGRAPEYDRDVGRVAES